MFPLPAPEHVRILRREDERRSFSFDSEFLFVISEEMTEVNVEDVSFSSAHDVVVVTVADAKDVGRNTVADGERERVGERGEEDR